MANMTLEKALSKASEIMVNAATHYAKDKGEKQYTAVLHARSAGYAMRVVFAPKDAAADKLEFTTENSIAVFHALYNHSAWRQKFEGEKYKLFAKKEKVSVDTYAGELEEEMGGE